MMDRTELRRLVEAAITAYNANLTDAAERADRAIELLVHARLYVSAAMCREPDSAWPRDLNDEIGAFLAEVDRAE